MGKRTIALADALGEIRLSGNICHIITTKPWQIPSLKWVPATVYWYFRARSFQKQ